MRGFDDHNTSGYHHDRRKQAVITAFVENPASRVLLRVSFVLCPLSLNVSSCVCAGVCVFLSFLFSVLFLFSCFCFSLRLVTQGPAPRET